jgi:hypothetical protein
LLCFQYPATPVGVVNAGINVIIAHVLPQHRRWQFRNDNDRAKVGYLCLKLCHALLSPVAETPNHILWQKLCVRSLLVPSVTLALLDVAITGELTLNYRLHAMTKNDALTMKYKLSPTKVLYVLKKD